MLRFANFVKTGMNNDEDYATVLESWDIWNHLPQIRLGNNSPYDVSNWVQKVWSPVKFINEFYISSFSDNFFT